MPSHLTHQIFVEEALARAAVLEPLSAPVSSFTVLGAQGPDVFYHNQRRKPSSLTYGSLVHRHGYGSLCAAFFRHAATQEGDESADRSSWQFAFTVAFASHAVLDRHTHPFINYWSGWRDPHDPASERLRGMHPFLERLIDREVLLRFRNTEPSAFGFHSQVSCGPEPPEQLVCLLAAGLCAVYPRARRDEQIEQRMRSAYLDTIGFYEWTDCVDEAFLQAGIERERRGEINERWLSIVHPPFVPGSLDVMNESHREWCHPCSSREQYTESFWDLFDNGLSRMTGVARELSRLWETSGSPQELDDRAVEIERVVGNWNLSDGRESERPCLRRHSNPLPLPELQQEIKRIISCSTG